MRHAGPHTAPEWARAWVTAGFPVVPLRGKRPVERDWINRAIHDPSEDVRGRIPAGSNLGLLMGVNGLVDLDGDSPQARELWHHFPAGGIAFGRAGVGQTHLLFRTDFPEGWTETVFYDWAFSGRPPILLEMRGPGRQVMAPGSIHPDTKEPILLLGIRVPESLPAAIPFSDLMAAARKVAVTAMISRRWPQSGQRHHFALAVHGGLVFHGMNPALALEIVQEAAHLAGDPEARERGDHSGRVAARLAGDAPVRGFKWIEETFECVHWGAAVLKAAGLQRQASAEPIEIQTARESRPQQPPRELPRPQPIPAEVRRPEARQPLTVERPFRAYPTHLLPPILRAACEETAEGISCDPSMVALPALSAAGASLGTNFQVIPNGDWREYLALWTSVICATGTRKTPAMSAAMRGIVRTQMRYDRERRELIRRYKDELREWASAPRDERGPKPLPPDDPRRCVWTTDATVEALAGAFQDNPRGILYGPDEQDTFFQRLTQYTSGTSLGYYLTWYSGGPYNVRRVNADRDGISGDCGLISICGTIQLQIFAELLSGRNIAAGMPGRFLAAWPPPCLNLFQRNPRHEEAVERWAQLIEDLLTIEAPLTADGRCPYQLRFSPAALDLWEEFHNTHARNVFDEPEGPVRASESKLWGQGVRLAGIFHCIIQRTAGRDLLAPVHADTVAAAIGVIQWHLYEHQRIYDYLIPDPSALDRIGGNGLPQRIIRLLRNRPTVAEISLRELLRSLADRQGTVTADAIRGAVDTIVRAGYGTLITRTARNGRPVPFLTFDRERDSALGRLEHPTDPDE